MKRRNGNFWKVLSTFLVVLVALLAAALAGVRLVGLTPYAVLSGSMEPTYHVGSLIYVKSVDPQEVQVGDPITFVMDEYSDVATHRVIRIDMDNKLFYTKGDANESEDGAPVYWPNLIGVPIFSIPYLGYFSNFVQHPPGIYLAAAGAAILLLLTFVPDLIRRRIAAGQKSANNAVQRRI